MSLPGLSPPLAAIALNQLTTKWLELTNSLPNGATSTPETDRLILAALLLAQEDSNLIKNSNQPELSKCLAVARSGSWPDFDEIPWLLIQSYVSAGTADPKATLRVENLLGSSNSSVREWFHYVAWMIQPDLNLKRVQPILLQNIADKLGGVMESTGLLASLYPDKDELNELASNFEPDGFADQYQSRLATIREQEWNSFKFNLLVMENNIRKLIWATANSLEVAP